MMPIAIGPGEPPIIVPAWPEQTTLDHLTPPDWFPCPAILGDCQRSWAEAVDYLRTRSRADAEHTAEVEGYGPR